jgi:DHA1 family bicyclomycin/chloramphenicol resistance-like MFS transporter
MALATLSLEFAMLSPTPPEAGHRPAIGLREFVILMAALMAVNALGVDTMLPGLPAMAQSLGITTENQRQWIITAYMIGFGATQIIYGPLADRFGRKPVMIVGLLLYVVTSLIASFADTFSTMIVARTLQGMAAASTRVLSISMIRDCYSGRHMARIMSLTLLVFLAAPIFAPSIGKLILLFAPWPAIFHALALFGAVLVVWLGVRVGETLHPEYRRGINPREIAAAAKTVVTNRVSMGYSFGHTMTFGALLGFVTSSQQVFSDVFDAPDNFPLLFSGIALSMVLSAFVNSRIVLRFGSRRVSHTALLGYLVVSTLHLISIGVFGDSLISFMAFQFAIMFCSGLVGPNFNAMAMEPMGAIAGTASSVQGTITTLGATLVGILIGQSFDGSVVPVVTGFFLCGLGTLCGALVAERGRLFRPHHAEPEPLQ